MSAIGLFGPTQGFATINSTFLVTLPAPYVSGSGSVTFTIQYGPGPAVTLTTNATTSSTGGTVSTAYITVTPNIGSTNFTVTVAAGSTTGAMTAGVTANTIGYTDPSSINWTVTAQPSFAAWYVGDTGYTGGTSWADQSGNGNSIISVGTGTWGTATTVNQNTCIRMATTSRFVLPVAIAGDRRNAGAFFIYRRPTTLTVPNTASLYSNTTATDVLMLYGANKAVTIYSSGYLNSGLSPDDGISFVGMGLSASNATVYFNGESSALAALAAGAVAGGTLGAENTSGSNPLAGDLYCAMFLNATPTANDIAWIQAYAQQKYGVQCYTGDVLFATGDSIMLGFGITTPVADNNITANVMADYLTGNEVYPKFYNTGQSGWVIGLPTATSLTQTSGTASFVWPVSNHGVQSGDPIVVANASVGGYNGSFTATSVISSTVTYSVSSGIAASATGACMGDTNPASGYGSTTVPLKMGVPFFTSNLAAIVTAHSSVYTRTIVLREFSVNDVVLDLCTSAQVYNRQTYYKSLALAAGANVFMATSTTVPGDSTGENTTRLAYNTSLYTSSDAALRENVVDIGGPTSAIGPYASRTNATLYQIDHLHPTGSQNNVTSGDQAAAQIVYATISAPAVPGSLTNSATTTTSLTFTWSAVNYDPGNRFSGAPAAGYKVSLDSGAAVDVGNALTYTAGGLSPGTAHTLTVQSYDYAGNTSAASNSTSGTTSNVTISITESYLPSNNAGGTQTAHVTATGFTFGGTEVFSASGVTGISVRSAVMVDSTHYTVTLNTPNAASPPTGNTGTLTLSDGNGHTATVTIAAPSFSLSPIPFIASSGHAATITATGTNTLWTRNSGSLLSDIGPSGAISSISVSSDTAATFTFTGSGLPGGAEIIDQSTGAFNGAYAKMSAPSNIPTILTTRLQGWYQPSFNADGDAVTWTPTGGSPITTPFTGVAIQQQNDNSGHTNHLIQTTTSLQPTALSDPPGIEFPMSPVGSTCAFLATNTLTTTISATNFSMGICLTLANMNGNSRSNQSYLQNKASTSGVCNIMSDTVGNFFLVYNPNTARFQVNSNAFGTTINFPALPGALPTNSPVVIQVTGGASSTTLFVDDGFQARSYTVNTAMSGTISRLGLGCTWINTTGQQCPMIMGEAYIANGTISSAEAAACAAWLKYDLRVPCTANGNAPKYAVFVDGTSIDYGDNVNVALDAYHQSKFIQGQVLFNFSYPGKTFAQNYSNVILDLSTASPHPLSFIPYIINTLGLVPLAILGAPSNDIFQSVDPAGSGGSGHPYSPAAAFASALAWIQAVKAQGCGRVYATTGFPRGAATGQSGYDANMLTYNALLRSSAGVYGYRIIDAAASQNLLSFDDTTYVNGGVNDAYGVQYVHPNNLGHAVMAAAIDGAISGTIAGGGGGVIN